ncbi:putative reverse transcriptase domain-containing protein [Tanacetum coccineum]
MVEPEQVKVEQYIRGLSKNICGDVTSSRPAGIDEAVRMAYQLMGQIIQHKTDEVSEGEKRKGEGDRGAQTTMKFVQNAKIRSMVRIVGNVGHRKRDCPKLKKNGQGGNNHRAIYKLGAVDAQQDPKVVTGTFFLNNRYATALFDSGANKSFVSTNFSTLNDIKPVELDTCYEVELADGKVDLELVEAREKVMRNASRQLRENEENYTTQDLELGGEFFADTHVRQERIRKPIRMRALVVMVITIYPRTNSNAQVEACKEENIGAEGFCGEGSHLKVRSDGMKIPRPLVIAIKVLEISSKDHWVQILDMSTHAYHGGGRETDVRVKETIQTLEDMGCCSRD